MCYSHLSQCNNTSKRKAANRKLQNYHEKCTQSLSNYTSIICLPYDPLVVYCFSSFLTWLYKCMQHNLRHARHQPNSEYFSTKWKRAGQCMIWKNDAIKYVRPWILLVNLICVLVLGLELSLALDLLLPATSWGRWPTNARVFCYRTNGDLWSYPRHRCPSCPGA